MNNFSKTEYLQYIMYSNIYAYITVLMGVLTKIEDPDKTYEGNSACNMPAYFIVFVIHANYMNYMFYKNIL